MYLYRINGLLFIHNGMIVGDTMHEQFLYYWLMWIIFIVIYFFMDKGRKRSYLMAWILLMIACTNVYFEIDTIQISLIFFLLLIGAIIFYSSDSVSTYKIVVTFTIMVGYVSLLMWEKITPVWFFMPSYFIIPVLLVITVMFLITSFYDQITVVLTSLVFGQLFFEGILISYRLHDVIGNKSFFIHVSITILFLIFIKFTQIVVDKITNVFLRYLV